MLRIHTGLIAATCLAVAFLVAPTQARADGHIDVKVVAEWPVDLPGVARIQLRRVEFAPGATLENFEVEHYDFCNATQGEWAVTNLADGSTALRTAGSRWRMPPKGTKVNITNPGNVPAVQFVYRLIETE